MTRRFALTPTPSGRGPLGRQRDVAHDEVVCGIVYAHAQDDPSRRREAGDVDVEVFQGLVINAVPRKERVPLAAAGNAELDARDGADTVRRRPLHLAAL